MDDIQYETTTISKKKLQAFDKIYNREKEKMIKELLLILVEQRSIKETKEDI